jgi:hypothetical protein
MDEDAIAAEARELREKLSAMAAGIREALDQSEETRSSLDAALTSLARQQERATRALPLIEVRDRHRSSPADDRGPATS